MVNVHSFDVFDTSLVRKVASPPDVFRLLASSIARKAGIRNVEVFVEDFVSARIRAEQQARSDCAETTLDRIWAHLRDMVPQLPPSVGSQDELDAERRVLMPNAIVAEQIARLRSEGARIIFTSDTYLPESFVRDQLENLGLAGPKDGLYVSNAVGVAKWTGELYKVILDRESIAPADLHHHGDDSHSDVAMPQRLGIKATLSASSRLNIWENAILSKDVQYRIPTSLLAGHMRALRLSAGFQSSDAATQLAATLLGPVLMVWAAWVLSTAQRDKVRRLYFVSRDAYLLCGVARILAPNFGDIDCRHLRISRQSTLFPSTDEISPSKMPWLRRPSQAIRIGDLVTKLGVKWSDVARHFLSMTGGQGESWLLTTEDEWQEFWRILQCPPLVDFLQEQIKRKRANVLAYLRAEGLCDDVPAGIVDLGWYMDVQTSLRKLLEHGEGVAAPRGYYLGVCLGRKAPADAGDVTALFYEQPSYHHWVAPQYEIFRRIDVLDHVIGLAPYGSVSEYEAKDSNVVAVGPPESSSHVQLVHKIGNAIESFSRGIRDCVFYYSDDATAREIIDTLVSAWCIHPSKDALEALDAILVTDSTGAIPFQPLLQSWRWLDAVKTLIPDRLRARLKISASDPFWPEAAFCRSGPLTQFVLRMSAALRLLRGRADLELLKHFFKGRK
jgi:FMN phosphatase YigB (HAD superfamily)